MSLFQRCVFILNSGRESHFKIECDGLTEEDWQTLAAVAVRFLPPFGEVFGLPSNGLKFAQALRAYEVTCINTILIADDVLTTGHSMNAARSAMPPDKKILGVVAFARGQCPLWVYPLFQLSAFAWGV